MLKKLFIVVWFGPLPSWIDKWRENTERLKPYGFDFLLFTDKQEFEHRVREKLGITPNIIPGTGKPWDFRPAFGLLFSEELEGYDFWGHTDPDCVYGRLDRWVSDEFLSDTDIFGNDPEDICGMFSLYRNTKDVNELFKRHPAWQTIFSSPNVYAFDEEGFSKDIVRDCGLRVKYAFWQENDKKVHAVKQLDDGSLFVNGRDTMVYHFRITKQWPIKS